ncbi:hypothetical protein HOD30_01595 [Candidatus Peregrinibacteria bacterium]|jgi:hypothetical protein|nr:hypothetical protein [Candidatus Peregrinibacteria bacterium]MBT4632202.1 hypothetical protein [Candidatus Peregrinibacteria bacterium]MBT5824387.1 hypothetical protein [Candidatus Peregrinibacteria bacterium]
MSLTKKPIILIATLLLCVISFLNAPLSFADDPDVPVVTDGDEVTQEDRKKSSSSFDVLDILDVDQGDSGKSNLVDDLKEKAELNNTSLVGAALLRAINILSLLVGTFAFVMLMIGGFIFIVSGGNETQIDRGKSIMAQSVLGLVVALLAYFIVTAVLAFFY